MTDVDRGTILVVLVDMIHVTCFGGVNMARTVTAQEARQRLGELLESANRGETIAIERAGRRMGVLISPQRFADMERSEEEARDRFWRQVEESWARNEDVDPDELEAMVVEEIDAYRREKREAARMHAESDQAAGATG